MNDLHKAEYANRLRTGSKTSAEIGIEKEKMESYSEACEAFKAVDLSNYLPPSTRGGTQ
jgi:hypothetical protein